MNKPKVRNEAIIHAPIKAIWAVLTDITQLHRVNPGVIKATGRMDMQGETRTCEIKNNGRVGTMTERLLELVPEKRTVWTIEQENMGFSKMLKQTRFCFNLEKVDESKTRVTNETYYEPANFLAKIMSELVIKKNLRKTQEQILSNIRSITEN